MLEWKRQSEADGVTCNGTHCANGKIHLNFPFNSRSEQEAGFRHGDLLMVRDPSRVPYSSHSPRWGLQELRPWNRYA